MMKFQHFFKSHQISSNLQNLFESSSETCMWNMSPFREVDLFHRKMLTVPALEIYHEISTFFQSSRTFIKLAEHIGIIIRNMHVKFEPIQRSFIFHRKMMTVPALEISWNFNIFSKFTKFLQTFRTYWNHHQKHACEIWAHSEKLTYFTEKYRHCRP